MNKCGHSATRQHHPARRRPTASHGTAIDVTGTTIDPALTNSSVRWNGDVHQNNSKPGDPCAWDGRLVRMPTTIPLFALHGILLLRTALRA